VAAALEAAYIVADVAHTLAAMNNCHALNTPRHTPNVQRRRRLCLQGDATADVHFLTI
jgi:hypothetical protein